MMNRSAPTRRSRILTSAAALASLASVITARAATAQETRAPGASEPLPATLAEHVPVLVERGELTGLSIAVVRDGEIAWSGAFGVQDAETGEPASPRTVFQAASLSKPVFAYVVLRLVERGVLDLDTPLADHLPYERLEGEPRYTRITPRMALSHSTGLPNWGSERLELGFDPGTDFNYSGEGFVYLQRTVEELTGLDLETLARQEVFEPLGMANSGFVWHEEFEGRTAAVHNDQGESDGIRRIEEPNSAWSLLTTAEDYARFTIALMNGEGLSAETLADAFDRQVRVADRDALETEEKLYWGLGWGLQYGRAGRGLWHWGHNNGFRDYVLVYPERREALVYLANSDTGLSIAEDLLAAFVDDEQWALVWLGYEQHDSPVRIARRELEKSFLRDGTDAGIHRFEAMRDTRPELIDERLTNQLGYFLMDRNLNEAAVTIFWKNARAYPESSNVWDSLGEGLMETGGYREALDSYEKSVALDPENEGGARAIAWLSESVAALENPVAVPPETLREYAGDYGPRHVRLRPSDGTLVYRRDGNPEYRLLPMSEELFMLDGLGSFRVRFVRDDAGQVAQIDGEYANGSTDTTERDP